MRASYRGYSIHVRREKSVGGYSLLYFAVIRDMDRKIMVENFTTGEDTVRDYVGYMRERIDAEHASKNPWGEAHP